ncbi:hypothetical protein C8F04DRAFT_1176331 [Mycena alexandri]|uniref:Uncharacterized protein n=1 Tax=Mycena alexandri TaxID=1745969 RepID=A0AAD6XBC1_9AGAR|nr:hypothetical protein C8F04DRAFT_1176331 [Mycena alexandri]
MFGPHVLGPNIHQPQEWREMRETKGAVFKKGTQKSLVFSSFLSRLCGQSAFARVTKNWVHQNWQPLPPALASQLRRRNGELPQVWGMRIDADFNSVDLSQEPRAPNAAVASRQPRAKQPTAPLSLSSSRRVKVRLWCIQYTRFSHKIRPVERHAKASRGFDEKISCPAVGKIPAFEASVSGSVDACIVANVSLAVTARELHQIRRRGRSRCGFRGHAEPVKLCRGAIHNLQKRLLSLTIPQATLDSGQLTLLTVGIRGLDFPAILTIGPSFQVEAEVGGTVDVDLDLTVDLTYCISGAKLFSRPIRTTTTAVSSRPTTVVRRTLAAFRISLLSSATALNFSLAPGVAFNSKITAHVIPSLNFGVAVGGIATSTVSVGFDTSSTLQMSLAASGSVSGGASTSGVAVTNKTFSGLDGWVDIGAGLSINAGADSNLFSQSVWLQVPIFLLFRQVNLFTKNFDFFKVLTFNIMRRSMLQPQRRLRQPISYAASANSSLNWTRKLVAKTDKERREIQDLRLEVRHRIAR